MILGFYRKEEVEVGVGDNIIYQGSYHRCVLK